MRVNEVGDIFDAVATGNCEVLESLVGRGAGLRGSMDADLLASTDDGGRTPLHLAVVRGDLRMVDLLIARGARLETADAFGLTPLGESARHGTRTGANAVRDRLLAAGANAGLTAAERSGTRRFVGGLSLVQLTFLALFATCTRYAPSQGSTTRLAGYPMLMDVHVMIFAGFGFLMTFLRKYGHTSVGLSFLLGALVLQWAVLAGGFFHQAIGEGGGDFHAITLDVHTLLLADFSAAAVLISFGALLGKVSPAQVTRSATTTSPNHPPHHARRPARPPTDGGARSARGPGLRRQ